MTDERRERGRLERLAYQRLGFVGCSSAEQIEQIVKRALSEPPPEAHPHSDYETGLCTECDAAWCLDRAREEIERGVQLL
jgi:hypothetical protein